MVLDHHDALFVWNHDENRKALASHGIGPYEASEVFFGRYHTWPTHDGRLLSVGRLGGVHYTVVWEWEGSLRRLISARRSDVRERRAYDREDNR